LGAILIRAIDDVSVPFAIVVIVVVMLFISLWGVYMFSTLNEKYLWIEECHYEIKEPEGLEAGVANFYSEKQTITVSIEMNDGYEFGKFEPNAYPSGVEEDYHKDLIEDVYSPTTEITVGEETLELNVVLESEMDGETSESSTDSEDNGPSESGEEVDQISQNFFDWLINKIKSIFGGL